MTGSGTFDLTDLTFAGSAGEGSVLNPSYPLIFTGQAYEYTDSYTQLTGPATLGSGDMTLPDSGSGDLVGLNALFGLLFLPNGYVSGAALSDTSTYDNATFLSLGITPGRYTWIRGTGGHADSFILTVGAIPEPGTLAVFGSGLAAAAAFRRRDNHKT